MQTPNEAVANQVKSPGDTAIEVIERQQGRYRDPVFEARFGKGAPQQPPGTNFGSPFRGG